MKIKRTCQDVQGKPVYLRPECKPRHTVGKIFSAIASGLIGAAVATMPQHVSAFDDTPPPALIPYDEVVPEENKPPSNFESTLKEQKERLQKIVGLSHTDPSKVKHELEELRKFYEKNYPSSIWSIWSQTQQEREQLANEAKTDFKIIFLDNLKLLLTNDIEKHEIAISNIKVLRYTFSPLSSTLLLKDIDKALEVFFNIRFQHTIEDLKVASSLIDKARELLPLVGQNELCINVFFQWMEKESKLTSSKNDNLDELKTLQSSLLKTFDSIPYHEDIRKRLKPTAAFLRSCAYLMSANKNNPVALKKAIEQTRFVLSYVSNHPHSEQYPLEIKEVTDLLVPLYDSVVKEICNLSESKEKTDLLEQVFFNIHRFKSTQDEETFIIKPLTKHYFSKKENKDNLNEFDLFMGQVISGANSSNDYYICLIYALFSLIDKNPDYFLSGFQKSIENFKETCKKEIDSPNEKLLDDIGLMAKYFTVLTSFAKSDTDNNINQELKERVSKWIRDNFAEPLFQAFIDIWNSKKVSVREVKTPVRNERFLDSTSWEEFNDMLNYMVQSDPYFANKLIDAVKERLKVDKDPDNRKMAIETLGAVMPLALKSNNEVPVFDLLAQLVVHEDSPRSMMAVGKFLADGIQHEHIIHKVQLGSDTYHLGPHGQRVFVPAQSPKPLYVQYEDFFQNLEIYSKQNLKAPLPFTKVQSFVLNLYRLELGDVKQFEKLTGRKLNPPTFRRTYRNKSTGEEVKIEITGSGTEEQRELDKRCSDRNKAWIFISEKIDRSQQDTESFMLFKQMMQNARAALAYSGSGLTGERKMPISTYGAQPWQKQIVIGKDFGADYRKVLLTMLGEKIGWHTGLQNLGYEVGPYIDLCTVAESEAGKNINPGEFSPGISEEERIEEIQKEQQAIKDLITERFRFLKQMLFDNKDARFKLPKTFKAQRLASLGFAKQVIDSAPSGCRMSYMDFLVECFDFSPRELMNIDEEIRSQKESF